MKSYAAIERTVYACPTRRAKIADKSDLSMLLMLRHCPATICSVEVTSNERKVSPLVTNHLSSSNHTASQSLAQDLISEENSLLAVRF